MQNRLLSRVLHLIAAVALGTFIYSPWKSNPTFEMAMLFGIFPILSLTGLWMWQAPRINKWFKRSSVALSSEKQANVKK